MLCGERRGVTLPLAISGRVGGEPCRVLCSVQADALVHAGLATAARATAAECDRDVVAGHGVQALASDCEHVPASGAACFVVDHGALHILALGDGLEVVGVDARVVHAEVVDLVARGDGADECHVAGSVCLAVAAVLPAARVRRLVACEVGVTLRGHRRRQW